jgi:protein PhnA
VSSVEKKLHDRSHSVCEINGLEDNLVIYTIAPQTDERIENSILITGKLKYQIENPEAMIVEDWRGLNDSMWNENLSVQIVSWRMLSRLKKQDLVEMMYLNEDALALAKSTGEDEDDEGKIIHKDTNRNILNDGDSVVLIKDLDVKGANFTAKRGAAVHNIKLIWNNAEHIEGRVENQTIMILTKYVKKTK